MHIEQKEPSQFHMLSYSLQDYLRKHEVKEQQASPKEALAATTTAIFTKLDHLAKELGQKKNEFGAIPSAVRVSLARESDIYSYLFRYLVSKQKAQLVSHAWLKMYEILSWAHIHEQLFPNESIPDTLDVFCNAELPGGFIGALNHFIPTILKRKWEWLASSLNQGKHLPDSFGLRQKYRSKWLQNAHMNGDVTNTQNLFYIRERVLNKFPKGVILYTSDAGCDVSSNYNEQEQLMSAIHLGQILLGLMVTRQGWSMIVKQFTLFHPFTCSLFNVLASLFQKVVILNPESSKKRNSEIYVLYQGFKMDYQDFSKSNLCSNMVSLLDACKSSNKRPAQLKNPLVFGVEVKVLEFLHDTMHHLVQVQKETLDMYCSMSRPEEQTPEKKRVRSRVFRIMAREVAFQFTRKYPVYTLEPVFWFTRLTDKRKRQEKRFRQKRFKTHMHKKLRSLHWSKTI
jgi:hypothetical protein